MNPVLMYRVSFWIKDRQLKSLRIMMPHVFVDVTEIECDLGNPMGFRTFTGSANAVLGLVALVEVNRNDPLSEVMLNLIHRKDTNGQG